MVDQPEQMWGKISGVPVLDSGDAGLFLDHIIYYGCKADGSGDVLGDWVL